MMITCLMQIVEVIETSSRPQRLLELLEKYHSSRRNRILVFVLYKKEASRVEETLNSEGWQVGVHSFCVICICRTSSLGTS